MKKLLLSLALGTMVAMSASADIYIIGTNVNGKNWSLGAEDAKFTQTGPTTYEWTGEVLGTGFKFNNGSWSNNNENWGGDGSNNVVTLGKPFTLTASGGSSNLKMKDSDGNEITTVENPKVVFEWDGKSAPKVTISGAGGGEIQWYLAGINNNFVASDDYGAIELYPVEEGSKQLESNPFDVTSPTGEFKIASTGWATEYGINDNPPTISLDNMTATLEEVFGEAGNLPYNLPAGVYTCRFNLETLVVEFAQNGTIDFSDWYVNIVGPFNEWGDNGVQPVDGITTTTGLPIGTEGFKVKVWTGTSDIYYITGDETPISLNEWVQLIPDTSDGARIYIDGATAEKTYDVQFDLATTKIKVNETAGVENIATDSNNEAAVYYNMQGIRVNRPVAGQMYIVRQGATVTKALVK